MKKSFTIVSVLADVMGIALSSIVGMTGFVAMRGVALISIGRDTGIVLLVFGIVGITVFATRLILDELRNGNQ